MTISKMLARASVSAFAIAAITPAFAQSTGSQEFEQPSIVVSGQREQQVAGIEVPNTPRSRQVLTQAFISRQVPGQSVDDIINYIPGVSFQNNDPYGATGGTLTIHGFDSSRISQTFDGIPLNDTGNYAIYSSEQLDSELIDNISVNLASTDIDSPTASATGATVNYTIRNPTEDFHARVAGSFGQWDYERIFGVIDTGVFTPFGTRAFVSGSQSSYNNPFNPGAKASHTQANAKIYQPIGTNGDFVSVAINWNVGRNSNFSSVPLRTDLTQSPTNSAPRVVGSGAGNRFPLDDDEREYHIAPCKTAAATQGVADKANSCGTAYDYSFNPSNNGNLRANSRFTLAPGLILTVDPFYEFVKANGGSSAVTATEGFTSVKVNGQTVPIYGYTGGKPYLGGVDLNGDGDTLDTVETYAPSHTETHRYGVISDLLYHVTPTQEVRVGYTLDYGRHRQTGEVGYLQPNGFAHSPFPIDNPILDASGNPIEKRNRLSYAILNQVDGQYRGSFLQDRLVVEAGVRAPFFTRSLHQYCVTENQGNGFIDCFNDTASQAAFLAAHPSYVPPQNRKIHYNKILPSAGFTYNFTPQASIFVNYSKGLQVPGTDNLYNSFSFAADSDAAHPKAETTDNFEGGVRYRSGKIQGELSGWYTDFHNRLASSYDPIQDVTVYRNLGTVHKYGIDGSVSYQVIPQASVYVFGSYLWSDILHDVQTGVDASNNPVFAATAGKRESGAPVYTFGARLEGNVGPVELGIQAKRTGPRYLNDENLPEFGNGLTNPATYGAKTPSYTLVDLNARMSLDVIGLTHETYLQFNVTNLFDKFYVGGGLGGGSTDATKIPFAYIGTPRTISGTINFAF